MPAVSLTLYCPRFAGPTEEGDDPQRRVVRKGRGHLDSNQWSQKVKRHHPLLKATLVYTNTRTYLLYVFEGTRYVHAISSLTNLQLYTGASVFEIECRNRSVPSSFPRHLILTSYECHTVRIVIYLFLLHLLLEIK